MLAYIFLESRKKLFKKRGIQYNKSINIDGSKVKLKANVDTILIGVGPMEEGKEGGCQLEPTAFVGLTKDELDICGKARTLLDADAGSEGNPPYPDGPQEGKWNFAKAAGRAAVTVVVIGGTAVVVCASMGASTPVIAGAAVTAGMAGGGMMVSDAIQGKVSSLEDYALSVASAELMFFTNQAMTHLITVTGMGFVSGTVAKAAGEAAAGAALDYLVEGEVDYERLARNLAINVVVDLGTGVLTGEAWEKPRQRTVEGGSKSGSKAISLTDRIKIDAWEYTPSDELYLKYKDIFDNPKYYNQKTGSINWPKNDGFASTPIDEVLQPGTRIDRYGSDFGSFTSPEGIPYEMRAVAPGTDLKPYSVFEVVESINVKAGKIASWFDEPGGGVQYLLPDTVDELLDAGVLRRIK